MSLNLHDDFSNQNALGGSISAELYQDAAAYDEFFSRGDGATEWREWSLLATDGDTALLFLSLTSKVVHCLPV